jgi:hypothetical protein
MCASRKKYLFDALFVALVVFYAWNAMQGRIAVSSDGVWLCGDLGNIVTTLIAADDPQNFLADPAFSNPGALIELFGKARFALIRGLSPDGNYAVGALRILFLDLILFYPGFYLLGLILWRSRAQAVLTALTLGNTVWIGWGTFWGVGYFDSLARTNYSAVLGFLLVFAWQTRDKPFWWPLLMAASGLLINLHAPNAIPMGFALWLGLWLWKPVDWGLGRRTAYMLFCGACFVLAALSYLWPHLHPGASGVLGGEDIALVREVFALSMGQYQNCFPELGSFLRKFCLNYPLLPAAAVGIYAARRWGDKRQRDIAALLAVWSLGVVLIAVGLHASDQAIANYRQALPLQSNLIRGLRLLIPFGMLAVFLGLSVLWNRAGSRGMRRKSAVFLYALATVVMCYKSANTLLPLALYNLNPDWRLPTRTGDFPHRLEREAPLYAEAAAALQRHTAPGDQIFYRGTRLKEDTDFVRSAGKRSLFYSHKDGGMLYYSKNIPAIRQWLAVTRALRDAPPTAYIAEWEKSRVPYLLTARPEDKPLLQQAGEVIWENQMFLLVKLRETGKQSAFFRSGASCRNNTDELYSERANAFRAMTAR